MLLRTKFLMPLFLVGFAFFPHAESADAATASRLTLNVVGSGASATFTVRATIYWQLDEYNEPGWQYEVNFHGMDGGVPRRVAAWTYNVHQTGSLQQTIQVVAVNNGRWANEDRDGFFFKRRDEIRVSISLYKDGVLQPGIRQLSNQVAGNF